MDNASLNPKLRGVRDLRRDQLEAAYRAGLVTRFTQVPGYDGKNLTWEVEAGGQHHTFESAAVPAFLAGLLGSPAIGHDPERVAYLAGLLDGTREPTTHYITDDALTCAKAGDTAVMYSEFPAVLGITPDAVLKHQKRGAFDGFLFGVDPTQRFRNAKAWAPRRELVHWGRANGLLNADGTPNTRWSDENKDRARRRRSATQGAGAPRSENG